MNNARLGRARRLAVRPSRANEIWYRARLLNIVKTARASFEPELRNFIKVAIVPENKVLAMHLAVTARNMVQTAKLKYMGNSQFSGITVQASRIATRAALMNLESADRQLKRQIRQNTNLDVQFETPNIWHGTIVQTVHLGTGDAAKVIQFPPRRYGSAAKTRSLVEQQISNNVQLIKSIPSDYFDRIADDIYDNMVEAQRWEVLGDKLYNTLDEDLGITRRRADLIARDQTSKMNSAFNQDRQESVGITHYRWQTAGDERVRPTHEENDGEVFAWDEPPEETGHPGHDVNCLPGDSKIQFANGISKAFRRWFDGELATIVTESGKTLSATPNHPVLTPLGWLAIGLLHEGDYVVEVADKVLQPPKEDQDDRVPLIRDVFESLKERGLMQAIGLTRADFHGDGANGDVDVVLTARPLTINHTVGQFERCTKISFAVSNDTRAGFSTTQKLSVATPDVAYGVVRGSDERATLLRRESRHAESVGFATVAELDPSVLQAVSNENAFEIQALGDGENAFSSLISENNSVDIDYLEVPRTTFGRIISVQRGRWSGHVFNLEAENGFYVANNILTHNCRCVALAMFEELEEAA